MLNCIDSDFAIAILKGDPKAKELLSKLESMGEIFITSISVFEMTYTTRGLSVKRKRALENFLDTLTVLPLDKDSALVAGDMGDQLVKKGEMIHPMDLLIGAVALENEMLLVTNSKKHFSRIRGLKTVGW